MSNTNKKHYVVIFDNLCTEDTIIHYYYDTEENVHKLAWDFSSKSSVCSTGNYEIYVNIFDVDD